jgi:type I restriction enzyme S subunit
MNQNDFDKICLQSKLADNYLILENSILIARSGTPGATRMIFNVENNVIFCGFIICMENFDPTLKSYLAFCLKKLENTSATKTGGSILQNVSQDTLKRLCVILPPKDIIAAFNAKTLSIFNYQLSIEKETARLTALRDKLLPLLMNGQVEVA